MVLRALRLFESIQHNKRSNITLTLEGLCILFAIYIQSNKIHTVVALIKLVRFLPRTTVCT